jgi:hypothetical protein
VAILSEAKNTSAGKELKELEDYVFESLEKQTIYI